MIGLAVHVVSALKNTEFFKKLDFIGKNDTLSLPLQQVTEKYLLLKWVKVNIYLNIKTVFFNLS